MWLAELSQVCSEIWDYAEGEIKPGKGPSSSWTWQNIRWLPASSPTKAPTTASWKEERTSPVTLTRLLRGVHARTRFCAGNRSLVRWTLYALYVGGMGGKRATTNSPDNHRHNRALRGTVRLMLVTGQPQQLPITPPTSRLQKRIDATHNTISRQRGGVFVRRGCVLLSDAWLNPAACYPQLCI